ncbi:MAG: endonuclease III [Ruthenibacterium sp.]
MRTKKDTVQIIERLKAAYPLAECSLSYEDAWQLLVSVRLAAQCTDARVNIVTQELFSKYPTPESFAAAGADALEAIVRPCGLGKSKARDLAAMSQMLLTEYGGRVPCEMDDLLRLPGVGRKSANLIRGDVFGLPAVVTDTHCIRLANRMGFVTDVTEPVKVERALVKVLPPEESSDFCHRCVLHGRAVCTARKAMCEKCCLADLCRTGQKLFEKTGADPVKKEEEQEKSYAT